MCLCELEQLTSDACRSELDPNPALAGYCYVDPAKDLGSAELTDACPQGQKRMLRLLGEGVPAEGARTFLVCPSG
jgi:hypothetical protein